MSTINEIIINQGVKMKKLSFLILFLSALFFSACQEENSITEPFASKSNVNQPTSPGNSLQWVELPKQIKNRLLKEVSSSETIKGIDGGEVKVGLDYKNGPFGNFRMDAKLKIPKHAFNDDQVITFVVTLDDQTTTATFAPHPMEFNIPLEFTLEYRGIDISGIDISKLSFAYLADDGTIQYAQYDKIDVNLALNSITVSKALIPHFSRFGFCR
jgi:hypothetical protein